MKVLVYTSPGRGHLFPTVPIDATAAKGLLPITDPLIFATRGAIARFALKHRLPGMYEFKAFVEEGGLISYGPDLHGMWRRAAYYEGREARRSAR